MSSPASTANSIGEFNYNPERNTFTAYFRRYKKISKPERENWTDKKKTTTFKKVIPC